MSALAHALSGLGAVVARLLRALIVTLVAVMLATLALQVVLRYAFDRPLSWSEELALTCFSWTMLLATALGVRDAVHVRMDLIVDRLPAGLRSVVEILVLLATAALGVFIAWSGVNYVLDTRGMTSAAVGYAIGWLYAAAPVCGGLIVLFALERALCQIAGITPVGLAPDASAP